MIQFVALLIFFLIARKVLTFILSALVGSFRATVQNSQHSDAARAPNQSLTTAQVLHQDPVCGTFVPGSSHFTRRVDGRTLYFCSAECRDRFLVSAKG